MGVVEQAARRSAASPSVLDLKFAAFWAIHRANFKSKKHTRNIGLLVSSSIPKFAKARRKRLRTSESGH